MCLSLGQGRCSSLFGQPETQKKISCGWIAIFFSSRNRVVGCLSEPPSLCGLLYLGPVVNWKKVVATWSYLRLRNHAISYESHRPSLTLYWDTNGARAVRRQSGAPLIRVRMVEGSTRDGLNIDTTAVCSWSSHLHLLFFIHALSGLIWMCAGSWIFDLTCRILILHCSLLLNWPHLNILFHPPPLRIPPTWTW